MYLYTVEDRTERMKLELPEWLGPRRDHRTRGFLVIKCILFLCLMVSIIETILLIPIYYAILENEAKKAPVGDDFNVWIVILSVVLSMLFNLVVITLGLIGVIKENTCLMIMYAAALMTGVLITLFKFYHNVLVIFSAISQTIVAILSLYFAHLINKYDHYVY